MEDVVIDRPLRLRGSGSLSTTRLRGTGTADLVTILSSGVALSGLTVGFTPARAALRIGDAEHPGVRDVRIENATFRGAGTGAILEATGTPAGRGLWIRFAGVVLRDNESDGLRLTGGNGKVQLIGGRLHGNAGAALRIEAAPAGAARNGNVRVVGSDIYANGAGVVANAADGLDLEGLSVRANHGAALDLYDVQGGIVACNRVRDGSEGVRLHGGSGGLAIVHNDFEALSGSAIAVARGAGAGVIANENLFHGAGLPGAPPAVRNDDDARHSWFGGVTHPKDATRGAVLTARAILRADAPLLVRRPTNAGWSWPFAACRDRLEDAIDAAAPGSLLLLGDGPFDERQGLGKPLTLEGIEGIAGAGGAAPTVVAAAAGTTLRGGTPLCGDAPLRGGATAPEARP